MQGFPCCRLCCVDENNHTFDEIEAGYKMSSYYVYVDENYASLIEIDAGLIHEILSTNMLTKIMRL